MAADDDKWQSTRSSVNEFAERLHLPPVFWETPIDYRQSDCGTLYDCPPPAEERPRTRYLYTISVAVSLVLHGAVLGYAGTYIFLKQPERSASVETTASINVNLVDGSSFEDMRQDQDSAAASAPASKPEDSGQQDDPKPAKLAQHEPDAPDAPKAPDDPDAPQEPAAPSSPASPDEPDAPTAPDTPSAPKEPEPEPEQKTKPDTPSDAPPKHVDTNAAAQDVAQAEVEGEPDADGEAELASEAEDEAPHTPEDATDPSENTTPPQSVAAIDLSPPVPASHPRRQTTHVSHSSQRHTTSRSHRRRKRRLSRLRQRRPSRRQVIVYRRSVRAYLAENKPIGGQGKGFVRVSFILSSTGRLVSARIIGSSGNHLLNQAVLNAVHNASPFPKPPARIRASRLRFNIPFYFH